MLEVESLSFGFPARTVGRDVSFSLSAGEVVCVLGPNGGGKSTLFRTLLGLLPMHGGSVRLDGRRLEMLARAEIARRIGYVPQAHAGYFAFTVRQMVLMGRTAHLGPFSAPARRDHEVAERVIESLGIGHLGDRVFTEISGGERQLALVARALAQEPALLVMDEPTASLDFGN
jgi:iron complex transport system ATP-binding protein